ncbi:MAG: hypothetical protein JNM70_14450 [Anaerolineae bacterium]|nr:hypothetical protein [Anaerolineae bacterium]
MTALTPLPPFAPICPGDTDDNRLSVAISFTDTDDISDTSSHRFSEFSHSHSYQISHLSSRFSINYKLSTINFFRLAKSHKRSANSYLHFSINYKPQTINY